MPVASVAMVAMKAGAMPMASSLKLRVITAVILMAGLVGASTLLSPFVFALFITLVVLMAAWEWAGFLGVQSLSPKLGFLGTLLLMLLGLFFLLDVRPGVAVIDQARAAGVLALGLLFWHCDHSRLSGEHGQLE